jgi:hypothetical protein
MTTTYRKKKGKKCSTRRNHHSRKKIGGKKSKSSSKKWKTAVGAADEELRRTGDYHKARKKLQTQALKNAQAIFGKIGSSI